MPKTSSKRGGKLNPELLEAVLKCYHEWGYCTISVLVQLLNIYPSIAYRYNKELLRRGYITDFGFLKIHKLSSIKGHWYAVSRKPPAPFLKVPTRVINHLRPGIETTESAYETTKGFLIPKHYVWAAYTMAWIAGLLDWLQIPFNLQSEHMIRTLSGANKNLTEGQIKALNVSTSSSESYNLTVPDARFFLPQHKVVFRVEVECSLKSHTNYVRLEDLFRSQGVPVLYAYRSDELMRKVSMRLRPSELISHIKILDMEGFFAFLGKLNIKAEGLDQAPISQEALLDSLRKPIVSD